MSPRSTARLYVWGFLLALGGFFGMFFPRTLMGEGKVFPINVIAGILNIFPEKAQPWAARLAGLGLFLLVAWIFRSALTEGSQTSSGYTMADLAAEMAKFRDDVATELRDSQTRYRVETDKDLFRLALTPAERTSAKPFVVDCMELASLAPKDAAARILAAADNQWGRVGGAPGAAAPSPPALAETVEAADQALAESGKDWEAGRRVVSIERARQAQAVYARLLGPQHPKTVQAQRMIDAATQMLQSPATPAPAGP